ncbi:hypothetical protein ACFQJ7_13595 [Halovenus rubra]|uniref:Tat (Twin-arginine translocation) pathway signal sequence n=2 Tax=Halovenus rubra TaxID=869890 RepID=A0ABD5X913_9EURY|nr:hypothetical protein [Halovenus rubra]
MSSDQQSTSAPGQFFQKTLTRRQQLKGVAGVATAAVAVPALSDTAAAHFPNKLDIDVQPDNADNFIDSSEHNSVEVAVHPVEYLNGDGTAEMFDPTTEPVRYRFGSRSTVADGKGARSKSDGEVREFTGHDGETHEGLVLTFPVDGMGFDGGEETAWLYWERDESGNHGYAGMDAVSIYGAAETDQESMQMLRRLLRLLR